MEAHQQKQRVFFLERGGGVGLGEWLNIKGTKRLFYRYYVEKEGI